MEVITKKTVLSSLRTGDTFKYDGDYFLVINPNADNIEMGFPNCPVNNPIPVVNLTTNSLAYLPGYERVKLVKLTITEN